MALNLDQWNIISEATRQIRALGCAVCVYTPDDVESMNAEDEDSPAITADEAADFLSRNRNRLEDRMSEQGNETLQMLLDMEA